MRILKKLFKKAERTDYKSLVITILDAYKHEWKMSGVKWDYEIVEEEEKDFVSVEIGVGTSGKISLSLFRQKHKSKIIILNDLWRAIFIDITKVGINAIYTHAVTEERRETNNKPNENYPETIFQQPKHWKN